MSVIIKDMETPQCCGDCHVGFCKQIGCELYIGFDDYATSRHPDCPISNIPTQYGRLIDADALIEDLERQCKEVFRIDSVSPDDYWITRNEAYNEALWKNWVESFGEYLKTRPTIIEAEDEHGSN